MNRVAIVDYGMGNLDSVCRAVEECGGSAAVTDDPGELERAHRIILPGVGAFRDGMGNVRGRSLDTALHEQVRGQGVPFLGICLGMQLLATTGWEGGEAEGLGWFDAEVRRMVPTRDEERIPHVGWNEVEVLGDCALFAGVPQGADFYFVHSYVMHCRDDRDVVATTPYCTGFTSVVAREQIFAVQFHPEKSQKHGFTVMRNFLAV